jgi:hypothetical protein
MAPTQTGSSVLSPSRTIAVIAPDLGLRQALTFALEVEGFTVHAYADWCSDTILASSTFCFVVDDQVVRACDDARQDLLHTTRAVILLTDGISEPLNESPGVALAKPFEGAELVRMVRDFALAA